MVQSINQDNIDALALGATLLGSGGGGDVTPELEVARHCLARRPAEIVELSSIADDSLVLPVGYLGGLQKTDKPIEDLSRLLLESFETYYKRPPAYLMPAEIGGANGIFPVIMSSITGLPLLNGDLIGRAFPQLNMASAHIMGISCSPAFICNSTGQSATLNMNTPDLLEEIVRAIATRWDQCFTAIGVYCMTGQQAKHVAIANTVLTAVSLGECFLTERAEDILVKVCEVVDGSIVFTGQIQGITQKRGNFLEGAATIETAGSRCVIAFKNEYLKLSLDGRVAAITPDIIAILRADTLRPMSTESLAIGTNVVVLKFRAPEIWYTKAGLAIAGPECFGGL